MGMLFLQKKLGLIMGQMASTGIPPGFVRMERICK